jgi:hypothetical protein
MDTMELLARLRDNSLAAVLHEMQYKELLVVAQHLRCCIPKNDHGKRVKIIVERVALLQHLLNYYQCNMLSRYLNTLNSDQLLSIRTLIHGGLKKASRDVQIQTIMNRVEQLSIWMACRVWNVELPEQPLVEDMQTILNDVE